MYRDHTVGVVVPAYDEARTVGRVVESLPPCVDRVYAVDDGSTDGTWAAIERAAASAPERVVPIRHGRNRGAGAAVRTGYLVALADGVDLVATVDADGQMDPALLPALLDPLVEGVADYAKGDRLAAPATRERMPRFRLVGNAVLTLLSRVATGYWGLGDSQNGYTAITRAALADIAVGSLPDYYGYCNDVLVRLNTADRCVVEVPHPSQYGDEESHIHYTAYVPRVSWILLRGYLRRLRRSYLDGRVHPLLCLYGLGVGTAVAGGLGWLSGLAGVARRDPSGTVPVAACVLLGSLLVLVAIGLDLVANRGLVVDPP